MGWFKQPVRYRENGKEKWLPKGKEKEKKKSMEKREINGQHRIPLCKPHHTHSITVMKERKKRKKRNFIKRVRSITGVSAVRKKVSAAEGKGGKKKKRGI